MLMNRGNLLRNKIRLIYSSTMTYSLLLLQVLSLVIYISTNGYALASRYFGLLRKDLYLGIVFIPLLVIQHRASIFSTYYCCTSRICTKRDMAFVDYATLAISTSISACVVVSTPMVFCLARGASLAGQEIWITYFFLMARYILLGLLVQYVIYAIFYSLPDLQKRGGSICVLPFLLFFVLILPTEISSITGHPMPILDFSAGEGYVFAIEGEYSWGSIFFCNVHLIGYLALHIWLTFHCISKRWEFLENESAGTL